MPLVIQALELLKTTTRGEFYLKHCKYLRNLCFRDDMEYKGLCYFSSNENRGSR